MPLSEDEQRILHEIEAQLYESDPHLASKVGQTTVYTDAARGLKWSLFGFFLSLVLMVGLLYVYGFAAAFVAFLAIFGCGLSFERNLRRLGRAGFQQVTGQMRGAGVRDYFNNAGQKARRRFQSDEEE